MAARGSSRRTADVSRTDAAGAINTGLTGRTAGASAAARVATGTTATELTHPTRLATGSAVLRVALQVSEGRGSGADASPEGHWHVPETQVWSLSHV